MIKLKMLGQSIKKWLTSLWRPFETLNVLRKQRLQRELAANKTWEISIRSFERKIQLEEVQFAFEQAEKLLKDSVENSQQIITRISIILTICGGALIFLGGHIGGVLLNKSIDRIRNINELAFIRYHFTFLPACFLALIFLGILLVLAYRLISLDYYTIGSQPKQLFVKQYFEEDNSDIAIIIEMYLGELADYQFRITENMAKNQKRWAEINILLKTAVLAIIEAGVILIIQLLVCF